MKTLLPILLVLLLFSCGENNSNQTQSGSHIEALKCDFTAFTNGDDMTFECEKDIAEIKIEGAKLVLQGSHADGTWTKLNYFGNLISFRFDAKHPKTITIKKSSMKDYNITLWAKDLAHFQIDKNAPTP